MKKSFKFFGLFVFALSLLLSRNVSAAPVWSTVGLSGFTSGQIQAEGRSLFVDGDTPYVVFNDNSNGNKATVMKFNGTSWENVGGAVSSGQAHDESIFVYGGVPYVGFIDNSNNNKATVMKFNGTSWENVGGGAVSSGFASYSSLFIDNGIPYLAYQDSGNSYKAAVMKFNGTSWENVGGAVSSGQAHETTLYIDNHVPYIAYRDSENGVKATVMKFNGTSWENVGIAGFTTEAGEPLNISFYVYNGTPYISYNDYVATYKIYVMKFNGTSWEHVGGAVSSGAAYESSIFVYNNVPYLAFVDSSNSDITTIKKFDGSSWVDLWGGVISGGSTSGVSMHISNDVIYVFYRDELSGGKATVRKASLPSVIIPTVQKLGDGSEDYSLPSTCPSTACDRGDIYGAQINFNVVLDDASKIAVVDAIENAASAPLSNSMWRDNVLRIYSSNPVTFDEDVYVDVTQYIEIGNGGTAHLKIIDSLPVLNSLFDGGDGSAISPYQIATCSQLQNINYTPDDGATHPLLNTGKYFELKNNIDCSETSSWNDGEGFMPIGLVSDINTWTNYGQEFYGSFDGNNYAISNLYINRPNYYYVGLFGYIGDGGNTQDFVSIKDLTISNANITAYGRVGILAGEVINNLEPSVISNVHTSGTVNSHISSGDTFHISQMKDGNFSEIYKRHYSAKYSTKDFEFSNLSDSLTLKINQLDSPFAGIDALNLNACGSKINPTYARNIDGVDVLSDVLSIDKNVTNAHEKDIEISWELPDGCNSATLSLTANEYGNALPVRFSNNSLEKYILGTNIKTLNIDGVIDEVSGMTPTYTPFWAPVTGHPSGDTYLYLSDDKDNLYFSFDVTLDNTDDLGSDWVSININDKRFLVNDSDGTYGKCTFGLTDKVSYKHQTCEIKIPKSEINISNPISFVLNYYGTMGGSSTGGIVGSLYGSSITDSSSSANVNGSYDVGGLIGFAQNSHIENNHTSGNINGSGNIGGLIGSDYFSDDSPSTVVNSYSTGDVTGDASSYGVGGLIGYDDGDSISGSYATGHVTGNGGVGGLIGEIINASSVLNSHATGNVTSTGSYPYDIGGLVGYSSNSHIENTYATGNVSASDVENGSDSVGGLIGYSEYSEGPASIVDSYATGNVSGDDSVGGLVGYNDGDSITNSYTTGSVTGTNQGAGGLVGRNSGGSIFTSYATGDVSGNSRVGGLTGANGGSIENSYAIGNVIGIDNVGGFSGRCGGDIVNSYSAGSVSLAEGENDDYGGFVGYEDGCVVINSFWDKNTSGQLGSVVGDMKTTIEMKNIATYTTNLGEGLWDFSSNGIWKINSYKNNGYPYLGWQVFAAPEVVIKKHGSSGSSASTIYSNLLAMGNTQAAEEVKKQFPNQITQIQPTVTNQGVSLGSNIRTLRYKMTGDDVKKLQEYLNSLNYNCGVSDGIFGNKTRQAVIKFQKAKNLIPDGIVGPKTREVMK